MAERFRVLSVMGRQLDALGISSNAVLRLAGLPSELSQETRIWLTTEEMRALYDAIAEVSGDPAVGLRLGAEERPENYSPISIPALFTRSFPGRPEPHRSIQEIDFSTRNTPFGASPGVCSS